VEQGPRKGILQEVSGTMGSEGVSGNWSGEKGKKLGKEEDIGLIILAKTGCVRLRARDVRKGKGLNSA